MKRRIFKLYVFVVSAIICTIMAIAISRHNNKTTEELANAAEIKLQQKETVAKKKLEEFTRYLKKTPPKDLFSKYNDQVKDLYKEQGISIYVYENDSLRFWSDNQPAIDLYAYTNETNVQLITIRNGWYEYIKQVDSLDKRYTAIALIAIKPEYDIENKYLVNGFSDWLQLPENTKLVYPINFLKHAVKSKFGNPLFEIYRADGLYKSKTQNLYACFFAIAAILLFIFSLFGYLKLKIRNKGV